jgi:AcrR family transcriptional regulator
MARTKAATFDRQRAAILDAAARLFAEKGFRGASMAQLARACGVSKALLYHYYRDKEQLLFDTAASHVQRLLDCAGEVRALHLPPQAHLRALIASFMREYRHSQARHMVLVQDVKFLGLARRARILAAEREVVALFARAIAALQPRARRRPLRTPLAMTLFGMMNWTFTWLRPDGPLTYDDMAHIVAELFLHGAVDGDFARTPRAARRGTAAHRGDAPRARPPAP